MIDISRVQKELQDCEKDRDSSGIRVCPKSDNLTRLTGTIPGPIGTPYEGGTFQIDITIPEGYPFEPPKMQFSTKVCLGFGTALVSVQALLSAPEPKDPQDAVVAEQYMKNYQVFVSTARYWTQTFAKNSSLEDKVKRLVEMGFGDAQVRSAIESSGGDENVALEKLCSG
ncbi:hypothetical protein DY000_02001552 [Brassica cretica]|uniref:E2 ubiquitin-conjugating enzyme n=1 Tax=Brassica cretica TaxID=69181 RepID=A0ABQ7BVB0_BRACR|nr:hypothetical protein DY000_02001552 [Brassica cretica]